MCIFIIGISKLLAGWRVGLYFWEWVYVVDVLCRVGYECCICWGMYIYIYMHIYMVIYIYIFDKEICIFNAGQEHRIMAYSSYRIIGIDGERGFKMMNFVMRWRMCILYSIYSSILQIMNGNTISAFAESVSIDHFSGIGYEENILMQTTHFNEDGCWIECSYWQWNLSHHIAICVVHIIYSFKRTTHKKTKISGMRLKQRDHSYFRLVRNQNIASSGYRKYSDQFSLRVAHITNLYINRSSLVFDGTYYKMWIIVCRGIWSLIRLRLNGLQNKLYVFRLLFICSQDRRIARITCARTNGTMDTMETMETIKWMRV